MLLTGQKLYCLEGRIQTIRELKLTFPIPVYLPNSTSHYPTASLTFLAQVYMYLHTYTNTHMRMHTPTTHLFKPYH